MFPNYLTLEEVAKVGFEQAQILKRNQHQPIQITTMLDLLADRAVALHPAGNDRLTTLAIFKSEATPAAVQAAIEALAEA